MGGTKLRKKIDFVRNVDGRINEVSEQTGLNKDSLFKEFFPEIQTIKNRSAFLGRKECEWCEIFDAAICFFHRKNI